MKNILIIGATSLIAEKCAEIWSQEECKLFLVGRNKERIHSIVQNIRIKNNIDIGSYVIDLNDFDHHPTLISKAMNFLGGIDILFIAHGSLKKQKECEGNFQNILKEINTNALSHISIIENTLEIFKKQRYGTILVISSIAGDRVRSSNHIYGTSKNLISGYLSGLRQRLFPFGIRVLIIKPGFVDTPMTKDFKKGFLWAKPKDIAISIQSCLSGNKDVIYTPWFWKYISLIIRLIPERIFKRLNF